MPDFRINREKQHLLADIITITIAGVLFGMENYDDIEDFAEFQQDWFKTFLPLPNGIPSHDKLNRVFSIWILLNLKHALGTGLMRYP